MFLTGLSPFGSARTAIVATAVDVSDPTKGLRFGPQLVEFLPDIIPIQVTMALVAGAPRVFLAGSQFSEVCVQRRYSRLSFESFAVNPAAWSSRTKGRFAPTLPEPADSCLQFADMTTGQFTA